MRDILPSLKDVFLLVFSSFVGATYALYLEKAGVFGVMTSIEFTTFVFIMYLTLLIFFFTSSLAFNILLRKMGLQNIKDKVSS